MKKKGEKREGIKPPEPRIAYTQQKSATNSGYTYSLPTPYQPEFGSIDRLFYPTDRLQQNRIFRMLYKTDPIVGTVIDLYADIMGSDMTLSGEGVEGSVKDTYEKMIDKTGILSLFPSFPKEYMSMGEVIPHLVFDKDQRIWTSLLFHNPDQIKVVDSPFIDIDPILEFVPDDSLKRLVKNTDPTIQKVLSRYPSDFLANVLSGRNIPLDSSLNVTFIARKCHPYDIRGTSILSRIFRVMVYEDAVTNCSIATARRHAGPLKICKVGGDNVGGHGPFIPDDSYIEKIQSMLTIAEQDPHAFLILPWYVQFEAFGTTERMLSIRNEWDIIERVKLTALGVSQGFLHGESTYSCFVEGTPVTLSDGTQKNIEEISINDKVMDKDGRVQVVEDAWVEESPETVSISAHGGFSFECTPNHKWPIFAYPSLCQCGCGGKVANRKNFVKGHHLGSACIKKEEWQHFGSSHQSYRRRLLKSYNPYKKVEASEIRVHDFLMIPRTFDVVNTTVSLDQARLLGYYVAEGFKSAFGEGKYGIGWAFNLNEKDTWGKDVIDICKALGVEAIGNAVKSNKQHDRHNVYDIRFRRVGYHDFACWFLEHGGEYSHGKKVSADVMQWPLELKKEFIKGYLRGDGHYSFSNTGWRVLVSSSSKQLMKQVQLILAQLGIFASYSVYSRVSRGSVEYRLRITGKASKDLIEMVWGKCVEVSNTDSRVWVDEQYLYVPVTKVDKINVTKKVYNLTVSGTHSYLVDNIAVFNSMKGNMQTVLMRLRGLRTFFENIWWYPKFFKPIAEMNDFVQPTQAELSHKLRFRRTPQEIKEDNRYIIPTIQWSRSLDSKVDSESLDAYEQIVSRLGIAISKKTILSTAGLDHEEEYNSIVDEEIKEAEIGRRKGKPVEVEKSEGGEPTTEEAPTEEAPTEEPTSEGEASVHSSRKAFSEDEIEGLVEMIRSGVVSHDTWKPLRRKGVSKKSFVDNFKWSDVEELLQDEGYTKKDIVALRQEMRKRDVVADVDTTDKEVETLVSSLSDDMSDKNWDASIDKIMAAVKKKELKPKEAKPDAFFVGEMNRSLMKGKGE